MTDNNSPEGLAGEPHGEKPNVVDFRDIAGCGKEVVIIYEGRQYRLLETKNGKLILNR